MLTWSQKIVAAVLLLLLIVAFSVVGITVYGLRQAAIDANLERLRSSARSWAVSLGELTRSYSSSSAVGSVLEEREVIKRLVDKGFGELARIGNTGEIRIGFRDGETIRFLFEGRPRPGGGAPTAAWNSASAEPMRRALSGEDGTLIGLDYRGVEVLAAHEPVPSLFLGVVAQIDKSEIEAPYYDALVDALIWLLTIVGIAGVYMVLRVYPMLSSVEKQKNELSEANWFIGKQMKELEEVQENVKQHARFLESLLDTIPNPIFYKDYNGVYKQCNREFAEGILGLSREEVLGHTVFDFKDQVPQHLAELYHQKDLELIKSGSRQIYETEVQTAKRQSRHFIFHKACVLDADRQVAGLIGVMLDITDRLKSEEQVRERQVLLDNILSNVPYGIFWKSPNLLYLGCNEVFAQIAGLDSPRQVAGRDDFDLSWSKEDAEWHRRLDAQVLESGEPALNVEHVHHDGWEEKAFLASIVPIKDADGKIEVLLGISADISDLKNVEKEKRQLEQQLMQVQRLESIGQLAAGVAHEINTPTQFVGDNLQFLKTALGDLGELLGKYDALSQAAKSNGSSLAELESAMAYADEIDAEYLMEEAPRAVAEALEGIERVSSIVSSMKQFSHPETGNRKACDLNAAINTTLTVARNEWKYVAELELDLDENLPMVPCYLGELNQALLNMIVNAAHAIADALPERNEEIGRLKISTRFDSSHAEITILDNGKGMPAEVQAKIFDPFFTTKDVGKGTGQGLSIAHTTIVHQHGGTLGVSSEQGVGTMFTIRLPLKPE